MFLKAKLGTADALLREKTDSVKKMMTRGSLVDLQTPSYILGRSQKLTTEKNLVMVLVPMNKNLKSDPDQELSVPLLKSIPQRKNSDVF